MLIGLDGNEANVKTRVGSGVYAFEVLKQFKKNKKHEFTVYLKDKPLTDLPIESNNFKYKIFGPKKLWTRLALPLRLTIGKKPNIFFSMGHYGPKFASIPYAVTIFDLSYLHFPEMFNKDDLYQLTNWSKHSILNSKHIFTISNSTKEDIVKNYGVSQSKITVTYLGFDKDRFKPQSKQKIDDARRKYKVKGDYIIFVGTLQPRKNIERLVEAIKLVKSDLKLVIVGRKGWMYEQIFQKVKDLKLESKIVLTDFVPENDLPALLSGAKAYLLPSLWEGFGIPVIEAQACGVPVVVSSTSSLPEVVRDSGVLLDPNNTDSIAKGIEKVTSDEKFSQVLIQKGFQNVKRFSWQQCAQKTLEALESL